MILKILITKINIGHYVYTRSKQISDYFMLSKKSDYIPQIECSKRLYLSIHCFILVLPLNCQKNEIHLFYIC